MSRHDDDSGAPRHGAVILQFPPRPRAAAPGKPEQPARRVRLRDHWWRKDFELGTALAWREQCGADRAKRSARCRNWDRLTQSRARRKALEQFLLLEGGVDDADRLVDVYWPGWAAVEH